MAPCYEMNLRRIPEHIDFVPIGSDAHLAPVLYLTVQQIDILVYRMNRFQETKDPGTVEYRGCFFDNVRIYTEMDVWPFSVRGVERFLRKYHESRSG